MKVLLIILGVLLLINLIPIGVIFRYNGEISLKLAIAFLRLKLMPKKPKSRKKLEKEKKKKEKKAVAKEKKKKKKQAQSLIAKPPAPPKPKQPLKDKIAGLLPWAKLGVSFVGEFFHRKLCVKRLQIRVALAGGDPAKLALSNGKAWEAIGITVPVLEQAFRIKKRKIVVYPDFLAKKTDVDAEIDVRLTLGGLMLLLLKYAFRAVKLLLAARKEKKKKAKEEKAQKEQSDETANPEKNTERMETAS